MKTDYREDRRTPSERQVFIAAARALLEPDPVARGEVPDWFGEQNLKRLQHPRKIADHFGTVARDGITYFVIEPYDLRREDIDVIDDLCTENGFNWLIDPNSFHYPCRTIRVVFSNRDWTTA